MRQERTPPQFEIQKYLVVSTVHVTPEDMEKLKKGNTSLIFNEFEYGASIYVGTQQAWQLADDEGFSTGMIVLLKLALDINCSYLKLDRDGPIVEGYKTYNW